MKALVADAEWAPRPGVELTSEEYARRRANSGSQVWRNPKFEVRDIPVHQVGDNDVLIKVKRCGICGTDSHLFQTDEDGYVIFSGPVKFPCTIGHEYSGIVEATGKNVTNLRTGDAIAAESIVWCGKCTPCRSGAFNQCDNVELTGVTVDGALAEYAVANELQCWKIDSLFDRYTDEQAYEVAALIEPIGCAYNGMFVASRVFKPGINVVVYGAGPIGLGAVALARISGASQVIAFDRIDERLAIAKGMGADHIFNTDELAKSGIRPRDLVWQLTRGRGAEMQIEAAGAATVTIPEMEASLANNGNIVYLGRAATSTPILLDSMVTGANAIVGSRGHSSYGIFDNLIRLIAAGRLQVKEMITSVFELDDAVEALAQSVIRKDAKIIVRI